MIRKIKSKKLGLLKKIKTLIKSIIKRIWFTTYWSSKEFMEAINDSISGLTINYDINNSYVKFYNDYGLNYILTLDMLIKHNLNNKYKIKAFLMANFSSFK